MSTIRLTMAQALVKFLDNQYVEVDGQQSRFIAGVFTIFGHGNVLGIGQALQQDPGQLRVHQGRNEQGMAHAAIGFAKQHLRRKVYACTASVGPGAANMLTAAATATANRIPLLLLPGDVFASRQPDPVLQQIEQFHDLGISTNDAFKAVSKYWDRINRPEQLMSAALQAMRVLADPAQTGAVTLALPQDVQAEAYDYPLSFFARRVHRIDRRPPTEAMLADAVALLRGKRKPLLICGGGVKYAAANQALQAFAERFAIPVAETQAGKSALLSSHPLNVGGIGETGCLAANLLAREADLIIGVGTRYSDFTTSSKWLFQHPQVQFLNLNINPGDAVKLDGVQLLADARAGLQALGEALAGSAYRAGWGTRVAEARGQLDAELERVHGVHYQGEDFVPEVKDALDPAVLREFIELTGSCLTQSQVLGVLNQTLADDAVIVAAAGSLPGDLQRSWRSKGLNTYHVEYGYSCMGYEIAAALGVKLAAPEREVYALVGDGSYLMLHSELLTSIQEQRKINVVLLDNMAFGCINNLQLGQGLDSFATEFRYRNPDSDQLDGGLIPVDYAMSAAAYGCKTYKVRNLEQLHAALADARLQRVSTLIDIKVLPKTMLHGYLSWWHVAVAEVSGSERVAAAAAAIDQQLAKARQY
ncbi:MULTISPECIES: 3D-(3,5/4)-trihydroxycyclohexane-1,2-dione acylhydrolase (decyclizing) [unclassified Pseudomonas]|uniref:3D-(3,5/4)-trihydroxycyclohexane-1,2-dione acylhydrolase (decyclizing) n=1 Tax=unclassified Pseudomonas TaxID=196821 RepID=UPI000876C5C1|nr:MULTISPECIES: 3D-(3,5/4)-trihydroxycyclohexane-1,2-dione acylhydrolase (decyclizing) [unclassified Pseudomonas]SCZ56298.1 3D-(3,5/4)-trihydroxycyclohexane-1,2-dione hydrolase [Pseudomonas sp. NFPP17]SDA47030.1 3D-(3,5/4)-trihydroxycyclohexane-1,2-dione hydrolase [Pseudomonas sp. NFPP15]SEK21964.1 3D-(3,5/4)-trihydroxycyclohexane-1,2-dione hydrolase [Pseudomonas sp. NFPP18]SFA46376.1 3D-(3,5/4)-trihydroxycyclohexane-1,2-dione hydrolase [Pseudomonas sp. NFPP13]SFT51170.1 3D-(3,5/4)-trihydroxy